MPRSSPSVRITILFGSADYRVFASATRRLREIMGHSAPDVAALIQFNLQNRDATGLADDYLDAIGWPSSAGRVISLGSETPGRANRGTFRSPGLTPRTRTLRSRPPADPSRN